MATLRRTASVHTGTEARRWSYLLPLVLAAASTIVTALNLYLASAVPSGPLSGAVLGGVPLGDTDADSTPEVLFNSGQVLQPVDPLRWEIWEYTAFNRWRLVHADTGQYPYPPGIIVTGNLIPWAIGDVDGDNLPDIVGPLPLKQGDSVVHLASVVECAIRGSYPTRTAWAQSTGSGTVPLFYAYTDLDRDGAGEVLMDGGLLFEARGNDSLVRVHQPVTGTTFVFGDFDRDSLLELVTGFSTFLVAENAAVGLDSYALVFQAQTGRANGYDIFSGRDLDGDGRDEVFVCNELYGEESLWQWEAHSDNTWLSSYVDARSVATPTQCSSACGDLDGDGIEELVWVHTGEATVYRAVADNQYQWLNSLTMPRRDVPYRARVADLNGNGYGELMVAGNRQVVFYEVEAVRVVHPDGGQVFAPGDTCRVRWRTLSPPRCDSVSLFLVTDTVVPQGAGFWTLDTIATGLPAADSSYLWTVPDTLLTAGWLAAIAFGPGWQYDMSNAPFRIGPLGLTERHATPGPRTRTPSMVGVALNQRCDNGAVLLSAVGRRVRSLMPGPNDVSALAPGVYFIRSSSGAPVRRVVVVH